MKIMRLTIFAIVLCGADALSLRGQPSLVPVLLAKPQNSSKNHEVSLKTLEDMETTMMKMVKSGNVGTPLKNFADLITPQLDSMEGAVNASHTTDQTTVDSLGTAFSTCTTAKTTADTEASTLLSTKTSQSTSHQNCRTAEGTAATNYQTCVTAMTSLESAKTTACTAYDAANKVPNINLVPTPGIGASYRSWLVSVKDWVINELATLDAANESCVNSTGTYNAKVLECEGSDGNGGLKLVHSNLKTYCNANQTALESTTCSYAAKVEDSCSQYETCYNTANTSYYAGIGNLQVSQDNRVLEYNLVKRMKCKTKLFSDADGADLNSADITSCATASHDTAHLNLSIPIVPVAPGPCQAVDEKPCTTDYQSTEYGSLPFNAQAATCQVCPGDVTTTVPPAMDCTTKTNVYDSTSCLSYTNFPMNGKSDSHWNYCVYPTQEIVDRSGADMNAAISDHNWMVAECDKACCLYPDNSHIYGTTTIPPPAPTTTPAPTPAAPTTTTMDCTAKADVFDSTVCLDFTNFPINGKSDSHWNYCVYPTQEIVDRAGATMNAAIIQHNWMVGSCEKACCLYPDNSHI